MPGTQDIKELGENKISLNVWILLFVVNYFTSNLEFERAC